MAAAADGAKCGPKTAVDDSTLVVEIRAVLAACPFHSEGHRKVHARLRAKEIRVGRKRVLRLMRTHHLLAPGRPRHEHGDPAHAGTIVTTRPDEMWGTDATRFYTEREEWCWFFGAVDHYTTEVMGWHVAKIGDRWAAVEPIRQGLTTAFGTIAPKVALGVALRHDWGSQYTANTFVNEIKCWGFTDTPAFVGEPDCATKSSGASIARIVLLTGLATGLASRRVWGTSRARGVSLPRALQHQSIAVDRQFEFAGRQSLWQASLVERHEDSLGLV